MMNAFEFALPYLTFVAGIFILVQAPMLAAVMKLASAGERRIYRLAYTAGQLKRELKSTVLNIALESLMIAAAFGSGLTRIDESHAVSTFLASFVWLEIYFYFTHRAMHTKLLWPVHRAHHESKVCSPLTAMTFSLAESLIMVGGLLAGVVLFSQVHPVSVFGFCAYFAFLQILVLFGHSNVEVVPPFIAKMVPFWSSPTHHALHHSRIKGHYGLMTTFLDRWLNTEFEDYRRIQVAAFSKAGLNSLGQRLPATADSSLSPAILHALVEDLRSGKLALNAAFEVPSFSRPVKIYQVPLVSAWLAAEVAALPGDVSLDLLLRFYAQQCAWYLQRQNEIFGPMSLNDLSDLKKSDSLRQGDVCFSLKWKLRAQPSQLPTPAEAPVPAAQELFVSRRQPRTRLQNIVIMKSPVNVFQAITMDVSSTSAAIYVKSPLKLGDRYQIEISNVAGEASFRTETAVTNIQPFGDGFRCGLMFINLERRATAKWSSLIKKSRTAAA